MVTLETKKSEAVFLYRLRSFIKVNSPDTINFARNDVEDEVDNTRRVKYSRVLDEACSGKESRDRALKLLKSEIDAIGISYDSLFNTEQYR